MKRTLARALTILLLCTPLTCKSDGQEPAAKKPPAKANAKGHAYQNSWEPQEFPEGRQTIIDAGN